MIPFRPSINSHYPEAVVRLEDKGCCDATRPSQKSFKDALQSLSGARQYNNPSYFGGGGCGCSGLEGIACSVDSSLEDAEATNQAHVENSLQNILNADNPNHQRVTPYRLPDGSFLVDESPNTLLRTGYQLDLGVEGKGRGFRLKNGEFTRDGRFKFNRLGRLVTLKDEIPLSITYAEGAPIDWSLKQIRVDKAGLVTDRLNGRLLGRVLVDLEPKAKVRQGYQAQSNVNIPLEFADLAAAVRVHDLNAGILAAKVRLDGEALRLVQGL